MPSSLSKGHVISVAASVIAGIAIAAAFFGAPEWMPGSGNEMSSAFYVCWILLTYLWIQLSTHIVLGPATKNEMLIDMLSSILPVLVVLYAIAESVRGDLKLSSFQFDAACLVAYAMVLDLVVDTGLAIALRRQG